MIKGKIAKLSCHDMMFVSSEVKKLLPSFLSSDYPFELVKACLTNVVISYFCFFRENGERAFSSPLEAAKHLSPFEAEKISSVALSLEEKEKEKEEIDERDAYIKDGFTEMAINESFR